MLFPTRYKSSPLTQRKKKLLLTTHIYTHISHITKCRKDESKTSLNLDLHTGNTWRVQHFHLEDTLNNSMHTGQDHIELTNTSTISLNGQKKAYDCGSPHK